MSFQKRVEDFTCGRCGANVAGNGYTNHCPQCLWSSHVDVDPGDRAEKCGGLMEPVAVEGSSPNYRIVHTCTACGKSRKIDADAADDPEMLLKIARLGV